MAKSTIVRSLDNLTPALTVNDCATLAAVTPQCIRNWIREGHIKAHRVGKRQFRIEQASFFEFMTANPVGGSAA